MFQEQKAVFVYCVSPVHMGAGTALGVIDNPIQRERQTDYPVFAGSGLKGAVRHDFWAQARALPDEKTAAEMVKRVFGPEPGEGGSDYAGAISFSDAQLVCFPVRSMRQAFLYTTSPTALARTLRSLSMAGLEISWSIPVIEPGHCLVSSLEDACTESLLPLEAFQFQAKQDPEVEKIARELAEKAFPSVDAFRFFVERMKKGLVVLHDEDFGYFVRNATLVEPHVRINDVTGTAEEGGLFYTENLPPESLLIGVLMASDERRNGDGRLTAKEVMESVLYGREGFQGLDQRMIQVGGDATTGRGQVVFRGVGGNGNA